MGTEAFPLFPLLPFELRALIWRSTVEPRTVEVRMEPFPYRMGPRRLTSSTPVPATLHACREARNLDLYERALSDIAPDGRYVWVNWDMDIIDIGISHFSHFHPCAPRFKRLQFERDNSDDYFYHNEVGDLDAFVNVKEVYIVCPELPDLRVWHGGVDEHSFLRALGKENVYLIDVAGGGRIMKAAELDAMMDQEYAEEWARDGFVYPTGEPLSSTST